MEDVEFLKSMIIFLKSQSLSKYDLQSLETEVNSLSNKISDTNEHILTICLPNLMT